MRNGVRRNQDLSDLCTLMKCMTRQQTQHLHCTLYTENSSTHSHDGIPLAKNHLEVFFPKKKTKQQQMLKCPPTSLSFHATTCIQVSQ